MLLVSAMGAAQGLPYMANDSAPKASMLNLGEALHVELGQVGGNVTVLLPGVVDAPSLAQLGMDAATMPIKPMSVEQCVDEVLTALSSNQTTTVSRPLAAKMMQGVLSAQMVRAQGVDSPAGSSTSGDDGNEGS